jgi:sulfatase maturation enzyme AslB (radical SAM superfamily)
MKNLQDLSSQLVCRCIGRVYDATRGPFPAVVRIETTNACNARCVICPHQRMNRPVGRMDDALFGRIIDQCAAQRCREVHLHNFGEPLLDKRLEERVRYAKQKGIAKVKIFSNGSLLTPERARGLIEAGLDEIKISFDGATREEFENIRRPLKFDRVVNNVEQLVKIRNELGSPMKIGVACCSTTDREATMQALSKLVDDFSFGKVHNWASEGEPASRSTIRKPCSRLWRTFTILAGGEIALCCLDYDGQHLLGRLDPATTIREIFDSPPYREARRRHREARQAEIGLCAGCSKSFL